jgi:hypothetical protein
MPTSARTLKHHRDRYSTGALDSAEEGVSAKTGYGGHQAIEPMTGHRYITALTS